MTQARAELRLINLLKSSPNLRRLALAWPDVPKEILPAPPAGPGDPWGQVRFSYRELSALADVGAKETLKGFARLKNFGIITPGGGLHPVVEQWFGSQGLAAFGLKPRAGGKKKDTAPEGE
jgi:hypothetical protein